MRILLGAILFGISPSLFEALSCLELATVAFLLMLEEVGTVNLRRAIVPVALISVEFDSVDLRRALSERDLSARELSSMEEFPLGADALVSAFLFVRETMEGFFSLGSFEELNFTRNSNSTYKNQ